MKQEDKNLLLKDLCGRLPYGVKIDVTYSKYSGSSLRARLCSEGINILDINILGLFQQSEIYIKPYLFPMSSMTEEQRKEFLSIQTEERQILLNALIKYRYEKEDKIPIIASYKQIDWLNKNHFDYRGLIPMGLAIDATNLNIY